MNSRFMNKINSQEIRRHQEDSEHEVVPEPPPRPESNFHSEPPPLPPKKQFSDIVIRPRVTSPLSTSRDSYRYGEQLSFDHFVILFVFIDSFEFKEWLLF